MLHVRDMDSYNQVFRSGTKYNKDPVFYRSPITVESLFNIHNTKDAKQRKVSNISERSKRSHWHGSFYTWILTPAAPQDMLQPHFSKAAIRNGEHSIQEQVNKFLDLLHSASLSKTVCDLSLGFSCLTADVVMDYAYNEPLGALDAADFRFPLILAIEDFFTIIPFTWYLVVSDFDPSFSGLMETLRCEIHGINAWLLECFLTPCPTTADPEGF